MKDVLIFNPYAGKGSARCSADKIRDAINPTGYTVTEISSRPYEKKGLRALFG